jgi:hypothetical protein
MYLLVQIHSFTLFPPSFHAKVFWHLSIYLLRVSVCFFQRSQVVEGAGEKVAGRKEAASSSVRMDEVNCNYA